MEINRNNFEAYLLDLLEGRLSAEDQRVVRDFLLLNPDCAGTLQEVEPWVLDRRITPLPGKEQLKKKFPNESSMLTDSNFDLFSIARIEGDLTREQELAHASMVGQDDIKMKQWEAWQSTKLLPAPIIFTQKAKLKRKKGIGRRVIWISVVSSAAIFALLLTLFRSGPVINEPELVREQVESLQAIEAPVIVLDPLNNQEFATLEPEEENIHTENKPALFSIKRNPERSEELPSGKGDMESQLDSDTVMDIRQEKLHPDMVKIAANFPSYSIPSLKGYHDQITPLNLPPASIHMTSLSLTQLAEVDLQEVFDDFTEENNLSLWTIANAGIRGINRLTGSDIALLASRDDEGDVSGIRFKSKRFSFATPLEGSD